jgi:hypothetical protein
MARPTADEMVDRVREADDGTLALLRDAIEAEMGGGGGRGVAAPDTGPGFVK